MLKATATSGCSDLFTIACSESRFSFLNKCCSIIFHRLVPHFRLRFGYQVKLTVSGNVWIETFKLWSLNLETCLWNFASLLWHRWCTLFIYLGRDVKLILCCGPQKACFWSHMGQTSESVLFATIQKFNYTFKEVLFQQCGHGGGLC